MSHCRRSTRTLLTACVLVAGAATACAETAPEPAENPLTRQLPSEAKGSNGSENKAAPVTSAHVAGFRSAQFGMADAEVRSAIVKDFGVDPSAIKASTNLAERTGVLTVRIPDVLPDGGQSDVSYIFGYKSKKLIQVDVLWSKTTDPKMTPERLLANGDSLRDYLQTAGYNPASILTNTRVAAGILMFRGSDADSHTTALILQGVASNNDKQPNAFIPTGLLLFYLSDPSNPDVFKIAPGKF